MTPFKTILLMTVVISSGSLDAQNRVTRPDQREALLARAENVLRAEPKTFADLPQTRSNPFAAVREQPSVAPESEDEGVEQAAPAPRRLSDQQALAAVARNFAASGSIVAGERKLLRLENGAMLREGSTFTARIQQERYEVTISEVNPGGYALSVGGATIRRRFLQDQAAGGGVSRTPANADTIAN